MSKLGTIRKAGANKNITVKHSGQVGSEKGSEMASRHEKLAIVGAGAAALPQLFMQHEPI